MVGNAAGDTWITLDTDAIVLPQESVAVHVWVTSPPHAFGVAENVERLDIPEIRQVPVKPLLYASLLAAGIAPQATVIAAGAVMVGNAAGDTWITLDTDAIVLPQESVAVHVWVTSPPHAFGVAENVERSDIPEIRQVPLKPLLYASLLAAGIAPQATVIAAGAVMVGNAAGDTWITLDTDAIVLPQESVAVHVWVTFPPQAPGNVLNVERLEVPEIPQAPVRPLLKLSLLAEGKPPQATVVSAGAVMVGNAEAETVIVLA
jgi:hypothetical protein